MKTILAELYDSYIAFVPELTVQAEVDNAHQALIRSLEKPERKLVLRIIDNKDLIAGARARESFEYGFWLADGYAHSLICMTTVVCLSSSSKQMAVSLWSKRRREIKKEVKTILVAST